MYEEKPDELEDPIISGEKIDHRAKELAEKIAKDFAGENPILLCLEKGGRIWADKVMSALEEIGFQFEKAQVTCQSYIGTESGGHVSLSQYYGPVLNDRRVIILEDIIDTMATMRALKTALQHCGVESIDVCPMLFKRRRVNWLWRVIGLRETSRLPRVRYVGFVIDNWFVIGEGLDYKQMFRNLRGIFIMTPKAKALVDK